MADKLSTAARQLLAQITATGEARIKAVAAAAGELQKAGLFRCKKGTATLTRAGRIAMSEGRT